MIEVAADHYFAWWGDRFENAADFLDKTAELARWLAAVTRVCP